LVSLIDDQRVITPQVAITLQLLEEDAIGHQLDARVGTRAIVEAHFVANQPNGVRVPRPGRGAATTSAQSTCGNIGRVNTAGAHGLHYPRSSSGPPLALPRYINSSPQLLRQPRRQRARRDAPRLCVPDQPIRS